MLHITYEKCRILEIESSSVLNMQSTLGGASRGFISQAATEFIHK